MIGQSEICYSKDGPRNCLDSGPAVTPGDLVNSEALVTICIANSGVNVVVVKNPSDDRVVVNTLSTRGIDVAVRRKNNSASASSAACTTSIDEAASGARGTADHDLIFLAAGRTRSVKTAALSLAVEHIVVASVLDHVGGLNGMSTGRLVDNVVAGSIGGSGCGFHLDLVKIVPERAEVPEIVSLGPFLESAILGSYRRY